MTVYEPGENVQVIADVFPAQITPLPDGVPTGVKLRAVIAAESLTIAWSGGRGPNGPIVHRWDERMTAEQTEAATYRGGQVGDYTVSRAQGCACGSNGLKNWNPFEGNNIVVLQRLSSAATTTSGPTRYSRS